jgi:uncharacterized membrane protein
MMRVRLSRILTLVCYFGLLALVTAWTTWLSPSPYFPVALTLIVLAFPLLLPLRGLLHGRARAHIWAAFLSLLYFIHGIGEAFVSPSTRSLGLAEVGLSLGLVLGASLYVRWSASQTERA